MGNAYSKYLSAGVDIPVNSKLYEARIEAGPKHVVYKSDISSNASDISSNARPNGFCCRRNSPIFEKCRQSKFK